MKFLSMAGPLDTPLTSVKLKTTTRMSADNIYLLLNIAQINIQYIHDQIHITNITERKCIIMFLSLNLIKKREALHQSF